MPQSPSDNLSSSPSPIATNLSRRERSARALASLDRLRGRGALRPAVEGRRRGPGLASRLRGWRERLAGRLPLHISVVALVALVSGGELRRAHQPPPAPMQAIVSAAPAAAGTAAEIPQVLALAPIRLTDGAEPVAIAPILRAPTLLADAYRERHLLAPGETLSGVAERYGIDLASLIWANRLDRGDALMVGQELRIPRVVGVPYRVQASDTLAALAERFAVNQESIATFGPNRIDGSRSLPVGAEIFIPGAAPALPADLLQAFGGLEGLGGRTAEPAGVILQAETNVRNGPSVDHLKVLQLEAGRQVALRARHSDWLLVEIAGVRGWIRSDLLRVAPAEVAALPESNDFPEPPPRWVWPTRGTITSRFGPRWGSFHNGLDIANRAWTPIVAVRSGTVSEAGWCRGYGYCVRINHGGGVASIYGHLIDTPPVSRGDEVQAGELIGYMGSTYDRAGGGYSTGVHLHLTILVNGRAVDPLRFLP